MPLDVGRGLLDTLAPPPVQWDYSGRESSCPPVSPHAPTKDDGEEEDVAWSRWSAATLWLFNE